VRSIAPAKGHGGFLAAAEGGRASPTRSRSGARSPTRRRFDGTGAGRAAGPRGAASVEDTALDEGLGGEPSPLIPSTLLLDSGVLCSRVDREHNSFVRLWKNRWCPSIACMKGLQCDAGRLLIEWVDESQMACGHRHGVDQTGGDGTTGPARSPDRPRRSGRRPAENCLLRRPASRWCNLMSLRVPRTMLVYIEPNTSPSLWWTPAEACHAGPCKKLDVRRSCMCRHTRYRGTPPKTRHPEIIPEFDSAHGCYGAFCERLRAIFLVLPAQLPTIWCPCASSLPMMVNV